MGLWRRKLEGVSGGPVVVIPEVVAIGVVWPDVVLGVGAWGMVGCKGLGVGCVGLLGEVGCSGAVASVLICQRKT